MIGYKLGLFTRMVISVGNLVSQMLDLVPPQTLVSDLVPECGSVYKIST